MILSEPTIDDAPPHVADGPDYIRKEYVRVLLGTGSGQAHPRNSDNADTLTAPVDWVDWCRHLDHHTHCLHVEAGLTGWEDRDAPVDDFVYRILDTLQPRHANFVFSSTPRRAARPDSGCCHRSVPRPDRRKT